MSACIKKVDIEAEKVQLKTVVYHLEQTLEAENMELLSKIMAHDPDMVIFGTDSSKHIVVWEPLREAI